MTILFVGCTSHAERLRQAREQFYLGDLVSAQESLERASSRWHRDADCLQLDHAVLQLVQGQPHEAERSLREIRDRFDYLEQKDLAESTLAMLTDDQRRAYAGEDYEKVLIRAMLALSNLMHDGQDAMAYSLQVEEKQHEIIARGMPGAEVNPKASFQQVALGPYLHGILREATHVHYDDAARSFAKVASWEQGFAPAPTDLARVSASRHSEPGNGVVYVFALVGRGPYKEEAIEEPTSDALLIADRMLSVLGKYQLPPTIAPIKVPRIVVPRNAIDQVFVHVDRQPVGATQTITDVGRLAVQQHQAVFPHLVARAVTRRVVKKAVAYGVQDGLDTNPWVGLGVVAAGVVWEFTEAADTRCWGLLPEKIQVLRVELPASTYTMDLTPTAGARLQSPSRTCQVPVVDGRNTYVLAYFPGTKMVGEIQVSDPSR